MKNGISCGCLIAIGLAYSTGAASAEWKPERNVEVIVGTASGSAADRAARFLQKIWIDQKAIPVAHVIVNKPGAGGELGLNYLAERGADGHYVSVVSPNLIANRLLGKSRFSLADVTPLALLTRAYQTFSVRPDSEIKSVADLTERVKKDPGSVSFAFGTAIGSAQHVAGALYFRALGLDVRKMKAVVSNASAQALVSVMGGHTDVLITTLPIIKSPVTSGKLRVLAVAAPSRAEGIFADAPTFKEAGLDVVFMHWNGVVGAKNMTASQVAFWDDVFSKTTSSAEWKKTMADLQQDGTRLSSGETRRFLEHERGQYGGIFTELGLIKSP